MECKNNVSQGKSLSFLLYVNTLSHHTHECQQNRHPLENQQYKAFLRMRISQYLNSIRLAQSTVTLLIDTLYFSLHNALFTGKPIHKALARNCNWIPNVLARRSDGDIRTKIYSVTQTYKISRLFIHL